MQAKARFCGTSGAPNSWSGHVIIEEDDRSKSMTLEAWGHSLFDAREQLEGMLKHVASHLRLLAADAISLAYRDVA
tara:strand:+ start:6773 stop:7000 length:228 start_codon:yes stop_codon:yes gene_type:complete